MLRLLKLSLKPDYQTKQPITNILQMTNNGEKPKLQITGQPTAFNMMYKPNGPICNLNCSYCYYLEKENLYAKKDDFKMPDDVLEKSIKQYIDSQDVPTISFVWQGGEPSLRGIDYYRKIVDIQNKYKGNHDIENAFQTNGTFLNDEWCRFFKENDFLVGISIDGPKHIHDKYRLTKGNGATFDNVMKGIELLRKHDVKFNTLSVVNDYNVDYPLEVYNFLKRIGSGFMQFIPIVERVTEEDTKLKLVAPVYHGNTEVANWSVPPAKYGDFLNAIFDEWVQTDVGKYYVQIFDVALANWVKSAPGLCVFAEQCGTAAVIEHNGDVYCCDHFVYPEYFLGNINDKDLASMVNSPKQVKFGIDKKATLPKQCIDCDVLFACHGGCPKNRITTTTTGEKGLNYLCSSYKKFFKHIQPYMAFMAEELNNKRAPANVMQWVKQKRLQEAEKQFEQKKQQTKSVKKNNKLQKKVSRNAPCPCGSGKKYKNCCRNK